MRIVLDTNCLLVVLPVSSPYRCLWDAFRQGKFALCYTTEMLLVTNDKHFNVLKKVEFPKINVINIDTFKTIMS